MKYIIRKNNKEEIIPNFEGMFLSDKLKKDYKYIYKSMKANNYNIRLEPYNLFFELVADEKVVGFAAYYIPQSSAMVLTETYVLPEFKSENLISESFLKIMASGSTISILEPSRDIIEFLIENNYATHITDSIITSAINFDMLDKNILGNFKLRGVTPSTNLYDLNLCSPIFLQDISTPGVCEILYLKVLPSDDEKYNCTEFRNSIDINEYFNDIKKSFLKNSDRYNETLSKLIDSLPKSYLDYNEIIGDGDELSDYFKGMVKEGMADTKTAIKIRNQLKKEYENEEVTDQSLALRAIFLLNENNHEINLEEFEGVKIQFDTFCPYCHSQVSPSSRYCQTCGYNTFKKGLISIRDIKK